MDSRPSLGAELKNVLATLKKPQNVYFQPPESIRMKYPCIVYKKNSIRTTFANNMPYKYDESYEVTVIDNDPDSPIPKAVALHFPMSRFNRHMVVDNLYHDVFVIYWYKNSKEE